MFKRALETNYKNWVVFHQAEIVLQIFSIWKDGAGLHKSALRGCSVALLALKLTELFSPLQK